ncbi:hypothetical protein ACGY7B_26245 [Burkholderia pseudomallei]|nr:hypothetical protein [Burkholderia pseudomallei]MBF3620419.1 hypothetical protein [Burkholderia pseudomallei]
MSTLHVVPALPSGLCPAQETTWFSCNTARHKTISLCGAPPASIQYRYGKPGQIELAFPDKPADGVNQLRYAHYWRYQIDRTEITFSRADTAYALFDYTEADGRNAGVRVTLPDGTEHEVMCSGPITSHLNALGKSLRCDTDNALNGGACP